MKKLFLTLALALVTLTLISGCSSGIERIGLQVHLIKLEQKADGACFATLRFSNPNVGSINVLKSSHQLALNGRPFGVLVVEEPMGLPAQQADVVSVVFKRVAGSGEVSGSVTYQLTSSITLSIYDDNTERYKTSSTGTVAVQ